jgi:glycosyltransferase involved in cell wall biosynthesis
MSQYTYSIVIPTYNREQEVVRAINSCLNQGSEDHEIIIVDDASTDGSVDAVKPYLKDPRVTLVKNETNQGEWGARAAGAAKTQGEWVIFLDSDDEILPGGLTAIHEAVREHGREFERLGFGYRYDDGTQSPLPEISDPTPLDFPGFLKWYSIASRSDAMWVVQRETFRKVPIPVGRGDHLLYASPSIQSIGRSCCPRLPVCCTLMVQTGSHPQKRNTTRAPGTELVRRR